MFLIETITGDENSPNERSKMNDYRDSVRTTTREASWTFWRILPLLVTIIVVLSAVGFGIRSCLLVGDTVVERKVFENSYQRQEAVKSEIAINEAVLIEIKMKLSNPKLDVDTRFNLEAQASAIRVRISAANRRLK